MIGGVLDRLGVTLNLLGSCDWGIDRALEGVDPGRDRSGERDQLLQDNRRLLLDHVEQLQQPVHQAQLLLKLSLGDQRPPHRVGQVTGQDVRDLRRLHGA